MGQLSKVTPRALMDSGHIFKTGFYRLNPLFIPKPNPGKLLQNQLIIVSKTEKI
jgi:hypothetical protein